MVKWIEDVSLCNIWYLTYFWVDKFKLKVKNIFNIVNQQTSHICEKKRPSTKWNTTRSMRLWSRLGLCPNWKKLTRDLFHILPHKQEKIGTCVPFSFSKFALIYMSWVILKYYFSYIKHFLLKALLWHNARKMWKILDCCKTWKSNWLLWKIK